MPLIGLILLICPLRRSRRQTGIARLQISAIIKVSLISVPILLALPHCANTMSGSTPRLPAKRGRIVY